jgi:hypothetical protein
MRDIRITNKQFDLIIAALYFAVQNNPKLAKRALALLNILDLGGK